MERHCESLVVSKPSLPQGEGRRDGREKWREELNTDLLSPVQNAQIPFHLDP